MKRIILASALFLGFAGMTVAQTDNQNFGIKFSGFVKTDFIYDTRQSSESNGIREGHFYLFPDNVLYDKDSNDVNANPVFHILSIQTRLKGDITGPDAFGAKTSGAIEAEFFGTAAGDINGLRLRHAFVKLDWEKSNLLVGQSWHPLFPTDCFPGTVSFNTGVPFIPFSRNPQLKFTYKLGKISAMITAYGQRDFTNMGPGSLGNKYMRNAGMPGLNVGFKIPLSEKDNMMGINLDYKSLRPRLVSDSNYVTDAKISSIGANLWLKMKTKPVTFRLMGTYMQNGTDVMMLGGYAVSAIGDTAKNFLEYTPVSSASFWLDLETNGEKTKFGLFVGVSKNLGATDTIISAVYARGADIDQLIRFSPRVTFTSGKLTFAGEIEATMANYGKRESDGTVTTEDPAVMNIRILLAAIYKF